MRGSVSLSVRGRMRECVSVWSHCACADLLLGGPRQGGDALPVVGQPARQADADHIHLRPDLGLGHPTSESAQPGRDIMKDTQHAQHTQHTQHTQNSHSTRSTQHTQRTQHSQHIHTLNTRKTLNTVNTVNTLTALNTRNTLTALNTRNTLTALNPHTTQTKRIFI
eukprot:3681744-Rhodomonas_salina.1